MLETSELYVLKRMNFMVCELYLNLKKETSLSQAQTIYHDGQQQREEKAKLTQDLRPGWLKKYIHHFLILEKKLSFLLCWTDN